jgi:DNA-directed RNA polymerase specialized sigma subunit
MKEQPKISQTEILKEIEPFVKRIVQSTKLMSPVIDADDLTQVGLIAAANAIGKFDATRGIPAIRYIQCVVRNAIYSEANKFHGLFTIPRGIMKLAIDVNQLLKDGLSYEEIVSTMSKRHKRDFSMRYIQDLEFLYKIRRKEIDG